LSYQILALPGFACTSQIWNPMVEYLAAGTRITRVDWPVSQSPAFHKVDDFSHWVSQHYPLQSFDMIIGHSLGGLVATHLLAGEGVRNAKLVLIESFLLPPGPYFQNLLTPGTDPQVVQSVTDMLTEQRAFYSASLQQSIREMDLTERLRRTENQIRAVYGDRGRSQPGEVIGHLNWPPDLHARIPVMVIPQACHFPMLENPTATAAILNRLITSKNIQEEKGL
jgi:pimeloyl-ACP methyl ester carboxylesterase